jgi:two-component sensor histidine kinase
MTMALRLIFAILFMQIASSDFAQNNTPLPKITQEQALELFNSSLSVAAEHPDSAIGLARKGWNIARKVDSDSALFLNIYAIGVAFDYKNILDSSLYYYDLGIDYAIAKSDSEQVNKFVFAKGAAHYYQGNNAEAIQYYDQALQYWESTGNLERQSKALNNIGIVYRIRKDYDKAIDIYLRSIEIKKQINDSVGLANSYSNLGRAYYYSDRHSESIEALSEALGLYETLGMSYDAATVMANLGSTYMALGDYELAEKRIRAAMPELEKKFTLDLLSAYLNFSIIERTRGNPRAALNYIVPYYEVVKEFDRINSRMSFEEELYACYKDLGENDKALFHLENYLEIYKESADESRQRLAEEMQTRFETREKENTIRLQDLELEKNDREKEALFFGVAFALLAVIAMIVFAVSKVRSNQKLSREKAKTESLLRDRETLLREIHHRVKNNLQVVSSLLSIQGREITDDKAQRAVNESRNRVHSMALIHQFLYGEQNLSAINMQEYVEQLSRKLFTTYKVDDGQVRLHVKVDPILLDVDTAIPVGLILNELITNSLKYAFPDGKEGNLWVSLGESEGKLTLSVKDDGVGVKELVPKSTSFGMKLLNAFKQKLDADFEIISDNGLQVDYHIRRYQLA